MNLLKALANPGEAMQDMVGGKMEEGIQTLLGNIEPTLIVGALHNLLVTAVLQEALRRQPSKAFMDQMTATGYTEEQAFGLWALVLKEAVVQ